LSYKPLVLIIVLLIASTLLAAQKQENPPPSEKTVTGTVDRIDTSRNSLSIRLGDATTTFTFDNKTVFTYGQHRSHSSELRKGDQVLVTARQGKATKVSATEQIQGIIELIDTSKKMLLVKVGDQTKEIPFDYFLPFNSEGKPASFNDMRAGDAILLNVNVGFSSSAAGLNAKKP
jgi:preprotein translocase subunit YajC